MADQDPTLHLVCGKIAAGKSTLCRRLAASPQAVLISEDRWMAHLFKQDLRTIEDYVRCSARLRAAMGEHVKDLLRAGLSVVLDFPANTVANRNWMRGLFENAGAAHQLHYLKISDATCRARLQKRNADREHEFQVTDEAFDRITQYFVPPAPEEGFNVIVYAED